MVTSTSKNHKDGSETEIKNLIKEFIDFELRESETNINLNQFSFGLPIETLEINSKLHYLYDNQDMTLVEAFYQCRINFSEGLANDTILYLISVNFEGVIICLNEPVDHETKEIQFDFGRNLIKLENSPK